MCFQNYKMLNKCEVIFKRKIFYILKINYLKSQHKIYTIGARQGGREGGRGDKLETNGREKAP